LLVLVMFVAGFFLCLPTFASAVPQSKLDEAKAAKQKIDELAVEFNQIVDQYNGAAEEHAQAVEKHQEATVQLDATTGRLGEVQDHLNKRAVDMYRSGPYAFVEVLLGATTFQEFTATWDILSNINEQNAANIMELATLKAEQVQLKSILSEQEQIAAAKAQEMEDRKVQIEAQVAQQQSIVAGLEDEIAQLRAEESAAAQAAAERAQAAMDYAPPSYDSYDPPTNDSYVPPPPGTYSNVLDVAYQFVGVPYVWGGSSPAGFDCSGLVQYCYAQVGVYLPRTSYDMMGVGSYVAYGDLQLGDIVITNGGGHVGLYVGGGQIINAVNFGDCVRVTPIWDFTMGRRVY
ncbi:MAG: NlpC/P60 family protein, partial [Actinomycetia bacterium]|nr:NlpC/P60 family protein [Actinomycetes bacterium]